VSAALQSQRLSPLTLYTSDACLGHDPGARGKKADGSPNYHPEKVARLEGLLGALRNSWTAEFGEHLHVEDSLEVAVTEEQLRRVHTDAYLQRVNYLFQQTQRPGPPIRVNLDQDTVMSRGSPVAATRAAGLVIAAVDDLLAPKTSTSARRDEQEHMPPKHRAFVMVRPPGHHAEAGKGGGFCIYNNVLIGVAHAQAAHGVGRVAILDFDVHHGNGDSDISWCDPTRLYASSH